jgi:hypothetical protein
MPSIYKGYDVVTRLGKETVIILKAEVGGEDVKKLLEGDYPYLFVLDEYEVELLGGTNGGHVHVVNIGSFKGYTIISEAGKSLTLKFEIPVSSKLIDSINDIRRKGMRMELFIKYDYSITRLPDATRFVKKADYVYKLTPTGERSNYMTFSTEEVSELMRELKYAELIRLEIPIPLQPTPSQEVLKKCVEELKGVEDSLIKGDFKGAIVTCRNIIMNYLTQPVEGKRLLRDDLRKSIMEKAPEHLKQIYEKILDSFEKTLANNLDHIHKFVKEDTGRLDRMPLREDVEYVYLMLIATVRYFSQFMLTWTQDNTSN